MSELCPNCVRIVRIFKSKNKVSAIEKTAYNERFHASGGVFPQTVLCGFESLSPARTFVEPPPAPSRHPVSRNSDSVVRLESEQNKKMLNNKFINTMKNILFIIFCSIAFFAKAQSIEKLITQIEKDLFVYERLSPWDNGYSVKDFNFTEQELDEIKSDISKDLMEELMLDRDSIQSYYVIEIFQERILENIDKIAHHKDFPKKGSEFFLVSPDSKLFNFVLDGKTGGSYRSQISAVYYRENNKIIYEEKGWESGSSFFNTDGYNSIDTIQTNSGVKYLLQGSVIGCNTCLRQYIKLLHFENGEPVSDFDIALPSRFGSVEQFAYDVKTKTITIEYESDDQNGMYDYENGCGDYYYEVYLFNGETFESIETHWKKCIKERIKDDEN